MADAGSSKVIRDVVADLNKHSAHIDIENGPIENAKPVGLQVAIPSTVPSDSKNDMIAAVHLALAEKAGLRDLSLNAVSIHGGEETYWYKTGNGGSQSEIKNKLIQASKDVESMNAAELAQFTARVDAIYSRTQHSEGSHKLQTPSRTVATPSDRDTSVSDIASLIKGGAFKGSDGDKYISELTRSSNPDVKLAVEMARNTMFVSAVGDDALLRSTDNNLPLLKRAAAGAEMVGLAFADLVIEVGTDALHGVNRFGAKGQSIDKSAGYIRGEAEVRALLEKMNKAGVSSPEDVKTNPTSAHHSPSDNSSPTKLPSR